MLAYAAVSGQAYALLTSWPLRIACAGSFFYAAATVQDTVADSEEEVDKELLSSGSTLRCGSFWSLRLVAYCSAIWIWPTTLPPEFVLPTVPWHGQA